MLIRRNKILFISHDATRTGGPILLLNLLKLLKNFSEDFTVNTIIKNGGNTYDVLSEEFEEACETIVWKKKNIDSKASKVKNFIKHKINQKNDKLIKKLLSETDYIFTNTLTNGDFLNYFDKAITKPVYCYVHELEIATNSYTTAKNLNFLKHKTHYYFAPSKAITNHLVQNLGIDFNVIYPLNYFIPTNSSLLVSKKHDAKIFNIGIVGTLDWRKGADILSTIVSSFFKKYPEVNIRFTWKGANLKSIEYERVMHELNKSNCIEKVNFEPSSGEMQNFYESIDLLLLPSKEDPYPLVVLEAASFKKPTICFDNAGGAPEFVENDAGSVIPYLDIFALVEEIFSYYSEELKCSKRGNKAFLKYKDRHTNQQLIVSQLTNGLNIQKH